MKVPHIKQVFHQLPPVQQQLPFLWTKRKDFSSLVVASSIRGTAPSGTISVDRITPTDFAPVRASRAASSSLDVCQNTTSSLNGRKFFSTKQQKNDVQGCQRLGVDRRQRYVQPLEVIPACQEIHELSLSDDPNAVEKAETIFHQLKLQAAQQQSNPRRRNQPPIDVVAYTSLMSVYARHSVQRHNEGRRNTRSTRGNFGYEDILNRATQLLQEMESAGVQPNSFTYTAMMDIFAKSHQRDGAERCQALLDRMWQLHDAGVPNVAPSTVTYTTLIVAYARRGMGEEAERVLRHQLEGAVASSLTGMNAGSSYTIPKPDVVSFSAVLDALSKSATPGAGERAENLLKLMIYHSEPREGISAPDGSLEEEQRLYDPMLRPNLASHTAVIDAWARSGHPNAGDRATQVFRSMQDEHGIAPSVATYSSLITVWSRMIDTTIKAPDSEKRSMNQQAVEESEGLFREMIHRYEKEGLESCKPNKLILNAMITVWARSRLPNGPRMAKHYLSQMKERWLNGGDVTCQPDAKDYTAVMDAFSKATSHMGKSNDAPGIPMTKVVDEIEALLSELREREKDDRRTGTVHSTWAPTDRTFAVYLSVLGRSQLHDKAMRCWNVIQEMDERNLPVNVMDLNEVLAACAWSKRARDRQFIFEEIVVPVMDRIHTGNNMVRTNDKTGGGDVHGDRRVNRRRTRLFDPDARTYQRFFMAAQGIRTTQNVEDHNRILAHVENAWQRCCANGWHNNDGVHREYQLASSHTRTTPAFQSFRKWRKSPADNWRSS